ncbi:hypothetical protein ACFY9S_35100, partial [Streptomyces sp. NPDC012474]
MVRPQHPNLIDQQRSKLIDRASNIPRGPPPPGEVVPRGESVEMVRPQHPNLIDQQRSKLINRTLNIP